MARMTDGQAQFVLRRLIENGTVSSMDVSMVAAAIQDEISSLEEQLELLRQASGGAGRSRAAAGRRRASAPDSAGDGRKKGASRKRRRKQTLTPERRARLRLQGQYLALMRRTSKSRRAEYKKLFRDKGLEAAIKAMESAR